MTKTAYPLRQWITALAVVIATCVVLPVYACDSSISTEAKHVESKKIVCITPVPKNPAVSNEDFQALKGRVKELEATERQDYTLELDGQRKQVDWWLSFLGIMLAGLAILVTVAGIAIPYVMARKDKEIIDLDKKSIEQDKAQIKVLLEEVKGMKVDAEHSVEEIHRHEAEAEAAKKAVMNFQSGSPSAGNVEIQEAAAKIEQDKTADPLLRLRAEAVSASKPESTEKAYKLWAALAEFHADDETIQFNAGYWAQHLGEQVQGDEKLYWLRQAGRHYEQALKLNPNMHEALYNWGNALDDEGRALLSVDLNAAQGLWRRAGQKFEQSLKLKHDKLDAWNNWGNVLGTEARAVSEFDLKKARELWQQASLKFQRAHQINSNDYEVVNNWGTALLAEASAISGQDTKRVNELLDQAEQLLLKHVESAPPGMLAYNLACVYGLRSDVQTCLKWLRVSQEHEVLPGCEHLGRDKDLDAVRSDPAFIEWFKQVCP